MSGVIGATGGKFVLLAATLLVHGRVDERRVGVAIAPGAATSSIAPDLRAGRRIAIGIGAMRTRADTPRAGDQPAGVALTIGRDLIDGNPIAIDFPARQLRLLSARDAARREARMTAIPIARDADGGMTVPLSIDEAPAVRATLDLASPDGVGAPVAGGSSRIRIGGVALAGVIATVAAQPRVGLLAFARSTVIFDLGHDRIWIAATR